MSSVYIRFPEGKAKCLTFNMVYSPSCLKLHFTLDYKYYTINPRETITLDS